MKRRRGVRVAIKGAEAPERPLSLSEQLQAQRGQMPKTSAHEVDALTPCCVCGGGCERSEVHWGPWRLHRGCERVQGDPVGRLEAAARALGRHLDRIDAQLLRFNAERYAETHPEPVWTDERLRLRLPWRHLDRNALYEAIERLPELRADAGLVDAPCSDGYCAWCGIREAKGWGSYGHAWADGSPAPLCGDCGVIYERSGSPEPSFWADQRAGIAEAATSVPVMLGETPPAGLLAYAEGDSDGDGTPWSHLPSEALEAFRWTAWGRWSGRYSPAEHRAEAIRRAEAADAARVAARTAKEAAEAARLDVYGFERQSPHTPPGGGLNQVERQNPQMPAEGHLNQVERTTR